MPDVQFSLAVTMDVANVGDSPWRNVKANNVARQINFSSDNDARNMATKMAIGVPDTIAGAENWTVAESRHTTLDNEFLDVERKFPNPVWPMVEEALRILTVSR
jgi:hypothetical protein